jgi:hypothetical protein
MRSLYRIKRDQFVLLGLKFKMIFWIKDKRLLFDESLALCSLTHGLTQINSTLGQILNN